MGCLPTVIICDYDLIQEVMKSESFSGRPHSQIPGFQHTRGFDDRGFLSGLTVTWGKPWREHKKFMQTTVNDLATGKKGNGQSMDIENDIFCPLITGKVLKLLMQFGIIRITTEKNAETNTAFRILNLTK